MILPLILRFGVLMTNALVAVFTLSSALYVQIFIYVYRLHTDEVFCDRSLWLTIHYGDRMRAWNDVGFSTAADN